jgi:hypothetical protein
MLEIFGSYKLYDYLTKKKEGFEEPRYGGEKEKNSTDGLGWLGFFFFMIFLLLIGIPITILACYLSWTSNTVIEWGEGFKVLFAFFAFFSPFNYLLTHLIHKYDLLTYIEKIKTPTRNNFVQ